MAPVDGNASVLDALDPRSVLVVRALPGLGDLLCAAPALRALRTALPDAHVALLALPRTSALATRLGCADEVVPFVGFPGIPESPTTDPDEVSRAITELRARRFDLAVQMHGSGVVSNRLTALVGARRAAGTVPRGQSPPDPVTFLPWREDEPEVGRCLRLVEHLGVEVTDDRLSFPVQTDDRWKAAALLAAGGVGPRGFACLHPGASHLSRRWSSEGFAAIGRLLTGYGVPVVVTGGRAERELTAAVARGLGPRPAAPVVDAGGRTDIGTLSALVAGARVVVTNDTGVSHLAAALAVPSVVVFTTPVTSRWAPVDRELHRVVEARPVDGSAEPVAFAEVASAVLDLLAAREHAGRSTDRPRPRGGSAGPDLDPFDTLQRGRGLAVHLG